MHILVGLGNRGDSTRATGTTSEFMALDLFAARFGAAKWKERAQAKVAEVRIDGEKVVLVKPQSFMNKSGQPLRHVLDFWKLKADAVTVFYDELDLPPSKVRIKRGGGSGGHNGIKSLDAHIGQNYRRVRIGIGHPGHKDRVPAYVLHDFGKDDRRRVDILLGAMADNLPRLLSGDEIRVHEPVDAGAGRPASGAKPAKGGSGSSAAPMRRLRRRPRLSARGRPPRWVPLCPLLNRGKSSPIKTD